MGYATESKRWVLLVKIRLTIAAALLALLAAEPATAADSGPLTRELTVVSWGGAYTRSQIRGFVRRFEREHGIDVEMIDYTGGIEEIRSQVGAWNVKWDVVDFELFDAVHACEEGLLVKIDSESLPPAPDGTPADRDFLDGSLLPCAVGNIAAATVIAFDPEAVERAPKSLEDFFDVREFPGHRGLRRTPKTNLEWALIADGVEPDRVYTVLDTDEGVDRAFRMLDRIKPSIRWWDHGEEALRLLDTGQVTMTSAYNGRVDTANADGASYEILWDNHVRFRDAWGIPKNGENIEAALDFVRFATSTESLAEQANYISYGPLRRSSLEDLPADLLARLPTSDDNLPRGFDTDAEWWSEHIQELQVRFDHWVERSFQVPRDWPSR